VVAPASTLGFPADTAITSVVHLDQASAARISNAGFAGRVSRGVGAMSLNGIVSVISQVTVVPVALYSWGKFRYGEWILLTGMEQFLRLTDLGLQTYVVNKLCASYARGDREKMESTLHSALRVQLPVALAILVAIAATLTGQSGRSSTGRGHKCVTCTLYPDLEFGGRRSLGWWPTWPYPHGWFPGSRATRPGMDSARS